MTLIKTDSGCKVGWETYDNEDEAKARSEAIRAPGGPRDQAVRNGYDFGYQSPGEVRRSVRYLRCRVCKEGPHEPTDHRFYGDASGPVEYLDEWVVTIP